MVQRKLAAVAAYQIPRSILLASFDHPRCSSQARRYCPTSRSASGLAPTIRQPPQKSVRVALQEQTHRDLPKDLGLLPETFIMPVGAQKPTIFRNPHRRWKLEVHRLKTRFSDLRGLLTYKFGAKEKPYPKLARRRVVPTAAALHRQMYTAFAEKDTATLSSICTEGLLASLRARIALRPPSEVHRWTMHKYNHSPRIVSNRAALLMKGTALRQAIVRIRSVQSLTKTTPGPPGGEDVTVKGTGVEKDMDEYFVVQRRIWKDNEEPWMVWGTTQESNIDKILAVD